MYLREIAELIQTILRTLKSRKEPQKHYWQVNRILPRWKTGANIVIDVWQLLCNLIPQTQATSHNHLATNLWVVESHRGGQACWWILCPHNMFLYVLTSPCNANTIFVNPSELLISLNPLNCRTHHCTGKRLEGPPVPRETNCNVWQSGVAVVFM
jgi:hypothetical protein